MIDLSESRKASEAPLESEARLQALLSSLDDLVFELDGDGTYLGIWTADDALLVAPREELRGRTLREVIPGEIGLGLTRIVGRVLASGSPELWEYCLDVPAGRRWFQSRVAPIAPANGSPGTVCLLVRDITTQKAAEDEISRGMERLELIHEVDRAILDHDSVVDLAHLVVRRLRRMAGADRASVVLFDTAAEKARFLAIDPPGSPGPLESFDLADLTPVAQIARRDVRSYEDLRAIEGSPRILRELLTCGYRSVMTATIIDEGRAIGDVNLVSVQAGPFHSGIEEAMREMADQLAVALRQDRLKAASEARANELEEAVVALRRADSERLELLSRLVNAQEEERQRIASDLHDDSIQKVTAANMRLEMLAMAHPDLDDDEGFAKAKATVRSAIESMRHLMSELRPYVLDRDGLGPALRQLLDEDFGLDGAPSYELRDRLSSQPPEVARVVLFRIAQEALTNVRKHAQASRVRVELRERAGGYFVRVTDDGSGFDSERHSDSPRGHLGLTSMRQRAQLAGGSCTIDSSPGQGTSVEIWLPLPSDPAPG
ncbi:MAG TPA: ATP-binding protein [Acidimicrobiales bacterium]|nr:ATP-binding protein [Acidimicrobiales bacterium]